MAINWKASTVAERRTQASIILDLVSTQPQLTLQSVFEQSFGRPFAAGIGYEKNFKDGKIARTRAALIYEWLLAKYPERAAELDTALRTPSANWTEFVEHSGKYHCVWLSFHPKSPEAVAEQEQKKYFAARGIKMRIRSAPPSDARNPVEHRVLLGSQFRFGFSFGVLPAGRLVALQKEATGWYLLPLSRETAPPVGQSTTELPSDNWLIEEEALGPRDLVFIIGPDALMSKYCGGMTADHAVPASVLDQLAIGLMRDEMKTAVIRMRLKFIVRSA